MPGPPDYQLASNLFVVGGILFVLGLWSVSGRVRGRGAILGFALANMGAMLTAFGFAKFHEDSGGQLFALVGAMVSLLYCALAYVVLPRQKLEAAADDCLPVSTDATIGAIERSEY